MNADRETPDRLTRRRQRLRRLLDRTARGGLILFLLTAVICVYGWRFGFTDLPEPGPDPRFPPRPYSLEELPPSSAWFWVRQMETNATLGQRPFGVVWERLLRWCGEGLPVLTNLPPECLEAFEDPEFIRQGDRLIECESTPDRLPDLALAGQASAEVTTLLFSQLWRAAEAERAGFGVEAFEHLLRAWQLWLRLLPVPTAHGEFPSHAARAWRRLTVDGPALSPADGRRLLVALDDLSRQLPEPLALFGREAWARGDRPEELASRGLGLDQVGDDLYEALSNIRGEWRDLAARIFDRMRGATPSGGFEFRGFRHFATPFGGLLEGWQRVVSRPRDLVQVHDAYYDRVVRALEAGQFEVARRAAEEMTGIGSSASRGGRWLNRPAVWRSLNQQPNLNETGRMWSRWWTGLQSCRLALAARLLRDEHGRWPEDLHELVPVLLTELPSDPLDGTGFRYHRSGDVWGLARRNERSGSRRGRSSGLLFLSSESSSWQASRGGGPPGFNPMTMFRYGILSGRSEAAGGGSRKLVLPARLASMTNTIAVLKGLESLPANLVVEIGTNAVDNAFERFW